MTSLLGNIYPNLPGMLVEFKDGGSALRFDTSDVNTDSLLLLGTAVDGPVMEPVAVNIDTAEILFGSDTNSNNIPNGSTLIHAFRQAYDAGCRDIRLMRISGSTASVDLKTKAKSVTTSKRYDEENISAITGNKETKFQLGETPIPGSVTVKVAAQSILQSLYDVKGNVLTIKANCVDSGALVKVKYKYKKDQAMSETLTLAADVSDEIYCHITSTDAPDSVEVTAADGTPVDPEHITYTQSTGKIVVDHEAGLNANEGVIVKYTVKVDVDKEQNCDDITKTPFLTEADDQVISLAQEPSTSKPVVLYIDGAKVLNSAAYTVDYDAKTLTIDAAFKSSVQKGQKISVSYYVDTTVNNSTNSLILESHFGGDLYNTGKVSVDDVYDLPIGTPGRKVIGKAVTIINPDGKKGTKGDITYTSLDYPTLGLLVDAINANNPCYKASTTDDNELLENLENGTSGSMVVYFENGSDGLGLSKDELYECLSGLRDSNGYIIKQGAYQLLENYRVDMVVPVGVYADDSDQLSDKNRDFAYELALFCAINSYKNKTVHGGIAMKPLKDTSLAGVQKHAKYLANYDKNTYYMKDNAGNELVDGNGDKLDLGKFISLVAGPGITFNHKVGSLREANPAVMYLAFNSTLQSQSAATNKKINGSTGLKYTFSNSQLNDIVGNRMVTFQLKYGTNGQAIQGAYCVDAPTSARKGSEYARLTTVRVIRDVADAMREVADPYIGEANTIEQRNSLSAAISKRLDLLVEKGVILDYSFNLVATVADQVLGQASLELGIVAPQELRKITTVIGLKNQK